MGCQSKKSYKPQSKITKKIYDLSVKEMKIFAKLRSHQIDTDFTKVATQYLHFMNKYGMNKYGISNPNDMRCLAFLTLIAFLTIMSSIL